MFGAVFKGVALSACLSTAAMATELTTFSGPVSIAEPPKTVISYDLGVLDTLTALGVDVAGITDPLLVPALGGLDDGSRVKIGTLFEPDFEQVFALKPDLIIAGPRSRAQIDALAKIAPTVDLSPFSEDIEEVVLTQTRELGALFGKEAKAAELTDHLSRSLDELRGLTNGAGKGLIVMTNGPKLSVFGPGSRFGWVHATLGVEPLIADVEAQTHGEAISFEFLHEANPDWLIIFDRTRATRGDGPTADETLDNELVARTTAMQKGQVIYVHPADFYIATTGVRSLQDTVDQFIDAFRAAQ
ncbi:siderophore ABC transporter substrate-binding protein [Celeribacter neptunius]|uniref:Iron complex transport system substrate-binding protein n=1 Tax=Celeribacter neptunius TaxID=588602 RepID=A0A1I3TC13_9RHOB|nr:siderophore ABC transporter substrate-binding protein [Celeribacter neptunius]SFJ68130.1 iron complex transport system substrate-binding protein [Celeribacter neptunius]